MSKNIKLVENLDLWINHREVNGKNGKFDTYFTFLEKDDKDVFTKVKIGRKAIDGCRELPKTRAFKIRINKGWLLVDTDTLILIDFKRIFKEDELTELPF